MKVLIIGTGGRENAIAWKAAQSRKVSVIYSSSAAASLQDAKIKYNEAPVSTNGETVAFCKKEGIDLVIIGPEAPLANGMADALRAENIKVFGAGKSGARLEYSKEYSKEFMQKYNIPTAAYKSFVNLEEAKNYAAALTPPIVIKADGLAAGKGVRVCQSMNEAFEALNDFMVLNVLGGSGQKVVIEDFLEGREASVMAFVDGSSYKVLPLSRDHKRLLDNDGGPNTGGMGVYSPVSDITEQDLKFIKRNVFDNVIKGLKAEGTDFCGILYAGIMKGPKGINVLEFNCRFGDPETQTILPLLQEDLIEIMLACVDKKLKDIALTVSSQASLCVILAGKEYPKGSSKDVLIEGLKEAQKTALVFHSGTRMVNGRFYTNGGRVLGVVGSGETLKEARRVAYGAISKIHFDGMQYRRDIGEQE